MRINFTHSFDAQNTSLALLFVIALFFTSPSFALADESFSASGKLDLRGVEVLHSDSVKEEPGLTGQIKLDAGNSSWKVHSWLEGGWDGTVKRPARDRSLFKNYDEVYQSNSPFLEFKELYLGYSSASLDFRAGIQRFAWGRLDEYPPNDLLNPWDYTQFLRKPLEDRKIGVPSLSLTMSRADWMIDAVWVPIFVPYRLPMPDERWSGISTAAALSLIPNAEIFPAEPDLPRHTLDNSSLGFRIRHSGDAEWSLNLFHGFDPRPVFKTTTLIINPQPDRVLIDPGFVPDFHRISVFGMDAATVQGDWSLRFETSYTFNRLFQYPTGTLGISRASGAGGLCLERC